MYLSSCGMLGLMCLELPGLVLGSRSGFQCIELRVLGYFRRQLDLAPAS